MKHRLGKGLFGVFILISFVALVKGSAWLQDPPSRSAAWYYQIKAPVNYNFRNLDCGGEPVRIKSDGSRNCGLCGDPYSDPAPRPNENGGKYANPIIRTRYYESGQEAEISIWNNLPGSPGFYEFRLCTDGLNPSQACLDQNLLIIKETQRTNMPVPKTQGFTMVHVLLPPGVTCEYCLLQWRFRKDNSVDGCDSTSKWCGTGYGPQIEYYNCADVTIGGQGQPKPNYIKDPVYSSADYGSAYDVVTTRTSTNGGGVQTPPPSGGLGGSNSTQIPIFTVPTLPPAGSIPAVTPNPQIGPTTERLILDGNGNPFGTILSGSGSSGSSNSRQLLLLLGLLPLLGAVALRNNNRPAPPVVVPQTSGFYTGAPLLSEYYLGTGIGFGNFGPGGFPVIPGFGPTGFVPGAIPSRVARSVSGTTSFQQAEDAITNDGVLLDPGQASNTLTRSAEMTELQNLVFRNGEVFNQRPDRITHVQPRSVRDDMTDTSVLENERSHVRHARSSGSEYGHGDTTYGSSNNDPSQWNRALNEQGPNFDFMSNRRSLTGPIDGAKGFRGGGRKLVLRPRMRIRQERHRQRNASQSSSGSMNDRKINKQHFQAKAFGDKFGSDFNRFLKPSRNQGFRTSRNPIARQLFRGKRPSTHDWYMTLMADSKTASKVK